jgi:hypothetical protein
MHPDIGDLLQGIKRTLTEEILPSLNGTFAREQLAYTLFLCEHMSARWDQAHIYVTQEHGDLRETLAAAVDIGRRCRAPSATFNALLDMATVTLATEEPAALRPLRALSTANAALKATLVRLLEGCEDPTSTDQDILTEMRTVLRGFMKRQLTRDEEWVSTAQIGWW